MKEFEMSLSNPEQKDFAQNKPSQRGSIILHLSFIFVLLIGKKLKENSGIFLKIITRWSKKQIVSEVIDSKNHRMVLKP